LIDEKYLENEMMLVNEVQKLFYEQQHIVQKVDLSEENGGIELKIVEYQIEKLGDVYE